ncbi:LPS assembly lipoprotein LptE [Flavobacteriales bacterium]|nr:LPS assembly lipoprotein LptE [Flavobacteriales bacterium]
MKKVAFLGLIILTILSCKIRYSTTGAPMPENIKTFSIDQFTNQASLGPSTIGFTFTESLRELFQAQTKLELVPLNGDLSYEGTIMSYTIRPISLSGDQTAAQNRLTISIKVSFVNQTDITKNFDQNFTRFADYLSTQDIASVQDALIEEIFDQLTQDIYDKTLGDW